MDEPALITVRRERDRPRKDNVIALDVDDFDLDDLPLPEWNPGFAPGDGRGTSNIPLQNDDFFADLPPNFDVPPAMDEPSRVRVVAVGSRMVNEVGFLTLGQFYLIFYPPLHRSEIHAGRKCSTRRLT